ncbi:hypothetical protein F2981_10465 [Sinorhizobium meliloti]|nr:hypothetical protein [Sinorhizobium meliloti]
METVELNEAQKKSRRGRNIALGIVLAALVAFSTSSPLVKVGGGMVN